MSKKCAGFVVFIALGMISLLTGCDSLQPEVQWDNYENRFIHMDYPAQWTYEEFEDEGLIAVRFEEEGEDYVFELSITGMENWLTEEEKLNMMKDTAVQQSKEEGFEILVNEETDIDGHQGIKIVDQLEDRGIRQTVATVFHYHQLAINFSGAAEDYNEHEELVNEMIDSIEIVTNP